MQNKNPAISFCGTLLITLFFSNIHLQAAPIRQLDRNDKIVSALRLPMEMRLEKIKTMGQKGFDGLVRVAFDAKEGLDNRWRAVTSLGRIYPRISRQHMEQALKSKEWFMRNSAALVLRYGDRDWAVKWSRILMHDQALVVRTAAVDNLRYLRATEANELLWEKLHSSENFRGGQSLWIRRIIAEALVDLSTQKETDKFYQLLSDKDENLKLVAMQGLKKHTKMSFSTPHEWSIWHAEQKGSKVIR